MALGDKISKLRKEKGLSQAELGGFVCVSNKAVSKWETGETSPDISLLPSIAEVLGITVDELLSKDDKVNTNKKAERGIEEILCKRCRSRRGRVY